MDDTRRQNKELARALRKTLSPQEKMLFDFHWGKGPQENHKCMEHLRTDKESASAAADGTKKKLKKYFDSKLGIASEFRISLGAVKGRKQRAIEVRRNVLPRSTAFWLGHLLNDRGPCIVLSEQNEWHNYNPAHEQMHRDWQLKLGFKLAEDLEKAYERPPRPVRLADVQAMLVVHSYLKSWSDKKLGYLAPSLIGSTEVQIRQPNNLVILGTSRDWQGLLEPNWANFPATLDDRNFVERVRPVDGRNDFIGPEPPDSGPPMECCGVLVSRALDRATGLCVTLINGSHPAAVQGVCELLVDDKRVETEVVKGLKLSGIDLGFPDHFQILFAVTLTEDGLGSDRIKACQYGTLESRRGRCLDSGEVSELRSAVNFFLQENRASGRA
jgi:hypothetical protein